VENSDSRQVFPTFHTSDSVRACDLSLEPGLWFEAGSLLDKWVDGIEWLTRVETRAASLARDGLLFHFIARRG
jgi:hypothetical protein